MNTATATATATATEMQNNFGRIFESCYVRT